MDRKHLVMCIASAEIGGFPHYAAALRRLYELEFGPIFAAIAPSRETFRWSTVQGADFRRSMDWAKTQPRLRDHIAAHKARKAGGTACQPSALPLLRASAISAP